MNTYTGWYVRWWDSPSPILWWSALSFSCWFVGALNLLYILIFWHICHTYFLYLTRYLSFIFAHGISKSPKNHRKFISDFSSRKTWASPQELVCCVLPPPPPPPPSESMYLFSCLGCKGAQNKPSCSPLATAQNLTAGILQPDLIPEFPFPFPSFVLHFFSYPLVCNTCKLPKSIFASRWNINKWFYFSAHSSSFHRWWNWGPEMGQHLEPRQHWVIREGQTHACLLRVYAPSRLCLFLKRSLVWFANCINQNSFSCLWQKSCQTSKGIYWFTYRTNPMGCRYGWIQAPRQYWQASLHTWLCFSVFLLGHHPFLLQTASLHVA